MTLNNYPTLRSWFFWGSVGTLWAAVIIFYFYLHRVLNLPFSSLYGPFAAFCLLQIVMAPALHYWRMKAGTKKGKQGLLATMLGFYFLIVWILITYYGVRLGLMDKAEEAEYYITGLISIPLASWIAYYFCKKILHSRPT